MVSEKPTTIEELSRRRRCVEVAVSCLVAEALVRPPGREQRMAMVDAEHERVYGVTVEEDIGRFIDHLTKHAGGGGAENG